eukprot:jgi/Orpsp1_1/1190778/evm.model.d7180000081179.1
MLENNSPSLEKPLSYSQIVLRNLKRKSDALNQIENSICSNYRNKNKNNDFNNNSPKNNISVESEKSKTNIKNEPQTEVTEKKRVTPVLHQVTKNNIDDLRKVYVSTFPLNYNSEFYSDIINVYPKGLSRV